MVYKAEIEIGGQLIDRHYGEWLDIWTELSVPEGKRKGYDNMVGAFKPTAGQVHHIIKLTKRHIPIGRYFADDDNSEDDYSLTQPLLFRRQTAIKARTDITPTEDDIQISDEMRIRLMLARIKALNKFHEIHLLHHSEDVLYQIRQKVEHLYP